MVLRGVNHEQRQAHMSCRARTCGRHAASRPNAVCALFAASVGDRPSPVNLAVYWSGSDGLQTAARQLAAPGVDVVGVCVLTIWPRAARPCANCTCWATLQTTRPRQLTRSQCTAGLQPLRGCGNCKPCAFKTRGVCQPRLDCDLAALVDWLPAHTVLYPCVVRYASRKVRFPTAALR